MVSLMRSDHQNRDDLQVVPTLAECEAIIQRGRPYFVEVGEALGAIRDHRLYLETHRTFEAYCRERWGFSRQRASQLIIAAVSTAVDNERQARRLRETPPEPPPAGWKTLQAAMTSVRDLSRVEAAVVASVVPSRRRVTVARDLRALGRVLGGIAARLEDIP